jgi:hypothetical protein
MEQNILKEHITCMNRTLGFNNLVNNITTESISSFISNITEFFSNKLSVLSELFTSNVQTRLKFKSTDKLNAYVVELKNELKKTSIFNTITYGEIQKLQVPTVVGLNTTYPQAAKDILPLLDIIKNNTFNFLNILDVETSKLITDSDYRTKTRPEVNNFDIKETTLELDKGLKKSFSSKRMSDIDNFGNLFPNNSSVKTTAEILINAGSGITLDNIKDLEERIASIVEKINVLVNQTKYKDYEISKETMKYYSALISDCSNYVTSCVSVIQAYNQLVSILKVIIVTVYTKFN